MSVVICTIIARNYLPAARVLASSFLEHHPDGRVSTLVIDDLYGEVDAASELFEVLRPGDVGIEAEEFHRMAMIYEVLELATAVKPWLIEHLLSLGDADAVVYLDPDIRVYAPLDELSALAQTHGIVLTPHVTAPMPRDGKSFDETAILAAGIYNLGFIAVGTGSQPFLDFWKERVYRECQIDVQNMRFVDQRWMDFTPGIFDCHVLRDTTYNVAYWNIYQRDLRWTGEGYLVDGQPLKFFHFSGFDVNHPSLLSKHQGPHPRVLLSESPDVARICSEYVEAIRASTREKDADAGYGFAELPNGLQIDREIRSLYRQRLVHAELDGLARPADPFSADGAEELATWLTSPPDGDSHRLSRYLSALRGSRRDLQAAFPDPDGADYDAYFSWAQSEAVAGRLPPLLVPPARLPRRSAPAGPTWAPASELRPGLCVAGYLRGELGMGQLARLVLAAAEQAGIEAGALVFGETISRQQHPFEEIPATDLNVNIVAVNADQLVHFANDVGPAFFEGRYTIGVWAWELEEFPETWPQSFSLVDEVWAISEFSRQAIAAATEKPVLAFPLPVVAPRPRPELDRSLLGLPDGFLFLFCFDFYSITERKNPHGLIQAFTAAFAPGEGPTLVLKTINGEHRLADLEALKLLAAERPDIMVIDRYFDHDENAALMAACDCYVSLHRSEGFGLTMAEAMALGKPVITTAYSGNLDFMDDQTAYFVSWTEGSVPEGCAPYRPGARWANPDLDDAARLMRRVVEHPDEAAAVGARAQNYVLTKHGLAARAALLRARFDHAQRVLSARSEAGAAGGGAGVISAKGALPGGAFAPDDPSQSLVQLARSRADIGSPSRFPAVSRPLRRAVARLTAHSDAHRAEVDVRLAQSVLALEARVTAIDRRLERAAAKLDDVSFSSTAQSILASQTAARVARLDARLQTLVLESQAAADAARTAESPSVQEARLAEIARRLDELAPRLRIVEGPFDESAVVVDAPLPGGIDTPLEGVGIKGDLLVIAGWAWADGGPAGRVEISVDGRLAGNARLRLLRPDIEAAFPSLGPFAGFEFRGHFPETGSETAEIAVEVVGLDGSRHQLPARVVRHAPLMTRPEEAARAAVLRQATERRVHAGGVPHGEGSLKPLLVFTHSLDVGGAQIYLNNLVRHLVPRFHGCSLVSPSDGSLRQELERFGVDVVTTGRSPANDLDTYEGQIRELTLFIEGTGAGVVLLNTLGCAVAADAAERIGVPVVWCIHESYAIDDWLGWLHGDGKWHPYLRDRLIAALGSADRLVFAADATSELFSSYADSGRRTVLRYGIDTDAISTYVRDFERDATRVARDIPIQAVVLLSVAVLQERKNPVCLVEAFSHLTHVHHDAMLVIVGDIPGPYSDALHRVIEASGLGDRVRLVPVTSDVWQWYALSDVFVAAGDIESMPISILEAMAFGLPTAATDVFGVHELINDGDNGWLFPARDVPALIATLDRVLALSPQERHVIGAAGRETVLGGYGPTSLTTKD
jgi:glycosyltransferase involved in cell wall biosynthesis